MKDWPEHCEKIQNSIAHQGKVKGDHTLCIQTQTISYFSLFFASKVARGWNEKRMQPLRRNLTNFPAKSHFWHMYKSHFLPTQIPFLAQISKKKRGKICPPYSENENYLLGIPELGVVVSEGMRTILWDLDWNSGDMPFKFDCLLLFSIFSFYLLLKNFWGLFFSLVVWTDSSGEEDKRLD